MLNPEVDRLSAVDLAVELAAKETDFERARQQNYQWAEELADWGRRFRSFLDWELSGYLETRQFLKGRSRVIALADYGVEKALVLAVPHRVLIGGRKNWWRRRRQRSGHAVRATARSDQCEGGHESKKSLIF